MRIADIFRMAHSTPFKDDPVGVHWEEVGSHQHVLWDENYRVGYVAKGFNNYRAEPYWAEEAHFFETQDEAKAWLVAMYKMGGQDGKYTKRRPAAK